MLVTALWCTGALLAAVPTRLAAIPLAVAALALVADGSAVTTAAGWVAAGIVGILLADAPRRTTLPILAAAAAAAAVAAPNATAFLPAWVAGTLLLVRTAMTRGDRTAASGLLLADGPVVAAGIWILTSGSLTTWTSPLASGPAVLVLVGAGVRLVLVGRMPDVEVLSGLRAQVLMGVALAASAGIELQMIAGGALVFALAPTVDGGTRRDVLQEAGLAAIVVAAAGLGDLHPRWLSAALATGTAVHLSRASVGTRWGIVSKLARGGGLGSPWWPVIAVVVAAGARSGGPVHALVVVGLATGMFARFGEVRSGPQVGVAVVASLVAVTAGLWWSLVGVVDPASLDVAGMSASALVMAAAAAGAAASDRVPWLAFSPRSRGDAVWARSLDPRAPALPQGVVWAGSVGLAAAATVAIWLGWGRGFL